MQPTGAACVCPAASHWGDVALELHAVLVTPLVSLIAGVLILLIPRLLNLIVAVYLIAIGVLGLAPHLVR